MGLGAGLRGRQQIHMPNPIPPFFRLPYRFNLLGLTPAVTGVGARRPIGHQEAYAGGSRKNVFT